MELYLEWKKKQIGNKIKEGRFGTINTHLEHWLKFIGKDTKLKELAITDCDDYHYERTKTCHNTFDLTRDNFGSTPNDNFRWQCRSCMRNHVKSYSQENPNAAKVRSELRKEREDGAKAIDDKVKNYLLNKFQNQCAYCGIDLGKKFHVDHIMPIAKNGNNSIENLAVCCIKCNLAKHAKTPEEFYAWMERKKIKFRLPKLI